MHFRKGREENGEDMEERGGRKLVMEFQRQEELIPDLAAMTISETMPRDITVESLREMSESLHLLAISGLLYAVQHTSGGRRRIAEITVCHGDRLYLHHLKEQNQPLPPNARFVKHSDVMRMVDPSYPVAFIQLSTYFENIGKVHIRLAPGMAASQQFALLCTGEAGPTYATTRLLEVREEHQEKEYIVCGDYERNNGSGGRALVPHLGEAEAYNMPWAAGTVWGFLLSNKVAAQFCILTRDCPSMVLSAPSFGMVEEGLSNLRMVTSHFPDVRKVLITSCGMVLNRSL